MDEQQLKSIVELCKQMGISYLGLFGSYSRNEEKTNREFDLLVEYSPDTKIKSLFDVEDLENKFESIFNTKIDLVSKKYLNPLIKDLVYADLRVIYEEN